MSEVIFPKVEIVEYDSPTDPEKVGHVTSALRINRVEFHAPIDSQIIVEAGPDRLTKVTATILVSEVQVIHA